MFINGVWIECDYSAEPMGAIVAADREAGSPRISVRKEDDELIIHLVDGIEKITIKDQHAKEIKPPGPWLLVAYGDVAQAGLFLQGYTTGCTFWTKDLTKALCWHRDEEALQQARNWGFRTKAGDELYVEPFEVFV